MDHCSWCSRVPVPDEPESTLVKAEPKKGREPMAICGYCVTDAVVALYEGNVDLAELNRQIIRWPVMDRALEEGIKLEVIEEMRTKLRADLLAEHEPDPTSPEMAEKTEIKVVVNRFMYERVKGLSTQAGLSMSAWVRAAIHQAFRVVSART